MSQHAMVMLSKVVKSAAQFTGVLAERVSPTGLTRAGPRIGKRESFEVLNARMWADMRHPNYHDPTKKDDDHSVKGVAVPGRIFNSVLTGKDDK